MDETAGFGLGLSIVRSIVLAHGGELSLNDRQPHGLIVRIQLPVRQQSQRAAAGARKPLSLGQLGARST
jgi:signal transduction histidine kinase